MLLSFVQERFPETVVLAKQQIEGIADAEVLQRLLFRVSAAQTADEVKKILFEVDDHKNKH